MTPTEDQAPRFDSFLRLSLGVGVVASLVLLLQLRFNHDLFFRSYLFAFMFWSGLTLGSLGIYLLHNVVGGNWGVVIRRFVESGTRTLPLILVLIIPIVLGVHSLYWWSLPGAVTQKAAYLNLPFWLARIAVYFAIWFFWGYRLLRLSGEHDHTGDPDIYSRMKSFAAPGLVLFVVSTSFAFIDWIMSIETDFFSTIYPWMFTVGQVLLTFAFCIALLVLLSRYRPFSQVITLQHFHDLGNLMLTFTMLWAYMALSQFLIVWAENLPDELPWYVRRFTGGWGVIAVLLALLHFCLPFVLLLMRFIKRNPNRIYWVAVWMIGMRILDVFWVVEPGYRQRAFAVYWSDVVAYIAVGGLWIAFFLWNLASRPLLPLHDPRIGETA